MRRTLGGIIALTCAVLGAQGQWANGIKDSLANHAEAVTVQQLIAESGGISAEACGGTDDAFDVSTVDVTARDLALTVRGSLKRALSGGTVHATLRLIKPKGLTIGSHLKYLAATGFTRSRKFSEPLCEHLGLSEGKGGCQLQPGAQELRFSFQDLPKVLFVGKYVMTIKAVDEAGRPITCAQGSLTVQPGSSKGLLRKLESGCPGVVLEHIQDGYITDMTSNTCDEAKSDNQDYLTTRFTTQGDSTIIGHWWDACNDAGDNTPNMISVYKRHNDLYKVCTDTSECNPDACPDSPQVCQNNGLAVNQCSPEDASKCEEVWEYHDQDILSLYDRCFNSDAVASGSSQVVPGWLVLASSALVAQLSSRL